MNSLAAYDSDKDSASDSSPNQVVSKRIRIDAAPEINTEDLSEYNYLPGVKTKEIMHNVPYQDLARPLAGPTNPFQQDVLNKNILTGFVEEHSMSDATFSTMERTYLNLGYTLIGNAAKIAEYGDPGDVGGYKGPWAGYVDEDEERGLSGPTEEEKAALEAALASTPAAIIKQVEVVADPGKEKSVFHGASEFDYLGRTYMHAPTDIDGVNLHGDPGSRECFIPKSLVHTWTGHTKGVNQIQFIPKTAHLILSASMDSKVKLWDVYNERKCLRTFMGHSKGVKAIDFSNDGKRFLSCSYDKWIKLWDTETGQCIRSFSTRRVPNCVTFNPGKQNIFLTGCADKKVYQFDINTGNIVQEYDQHLGAVNTVTFVDDNRRFITTSDDKTLRAWEYGIPVVIKYVAEPDMHSMPAVTLHPSHKWLACQSLDNQILIYSAKDRFKLQRKKVFKGHLIAGYACKPGFSADGRFIMSGDSEGRVWFWDWKTCKVYKKFKAHENVVMDCQWHPHESSKVATCSWDGTIKYWD
ncbi:WD40-repeat-containing domain protein [Obelidium mucronatum]|nr:WD40-repeat-containing domain protein [Obelidium mucronatum]